MSANNSLSELGGHEEPAGAKMTRKMSRKMSSRANMGCVSSSLSLSRSLSLSLSLSLSFSPLTYSPKTASNSLAVNL